MKRMKQFFVVLSILACIGISSCDENGDLLLFSIQDDIALGEQVAAEIESMPDVYPILSRQQYSEAYAIMDGMFNEILSSDDVTYRDEFPWELFIIDDDQTLNAFATPGGFIYVYTGLIYFLDNEDDLAGVLGHEIAHSDQRHSSKSLQRQYGISFLLSVLTGNQSESVQLIVESIAGVGALEFSRDAEAEADDFSVLYLADTDYACNGAADFFQKLLDREQAGGTPEFLSTHPTPSSRVEEINTKASSQGCSTDLNDADGSSLRALQDLLP